MSRILIVTDAWKPQVNGVVRSIEALSRDLESGGHAVGIIGPDRFRTLPLPTYPEIRLALHPRRRLERLASAFRPDTIHLPTEGPLGWAGRALARDWTLPVTTGFHTRFPEYVARRGLMPRSVAYMFMRKFHEGSQGVLVSTPTLEQELGRRGFANLRRWTPGIDLAVFRRRESELFAGLPRPVLLYAGRVAVEKNIEAFLALQLRGTKVVAGDGPSRGTLQARYPGTLFMGSLPPETLAQAYSAADVLVFPSRTDTFGLVLAEALACGTPVAAYPVAGPQDVLAAQATDRPVGILDGDLGQAIRRVLALDIPPSRCRAYAQAQFSQGRAQSYAEAVLSPIAPS